MTTTTHQIKTLRKLGDRAAFWCVDCNKQWGPYDVVDESEECAARVQAPAEKEEAHTA